MALPGSTRYGIDAAPRGLDVVQDLLNTSSAGRDEPTTDLLRDLAHAQRWADPVRRSVGLDGRAMSPAELRRLRDLRTALRDTIHLRDGLADARAAPVGATVALRLDPDGTVQADGPGLVETILLEVHTAQARGDWGRLKLCALDICDLSFYDRTRNTSARYHTPRCANFVNLHNSRERRRRDAGSG